MSIEIKAVRAFSDNYIWLILNSDKKQAIAIDPGQAAPVVDFLEQNEFKLSAIWITHDHNDHVGGVEALTARYECAVYAAARHKLSLTHRHLLQCVDQDDETQAWAYSAQVWRTFGHTDNHLSFVLKIHGKYHVFCGDTLFNAGCGRVFTGTIAQLFDSFVAYNQLPDDTLFYAAHEYTLNNLKFAKALSPNNKEIDDCIIYYEHKLDEGGITLPTDLSCQRKINPFMQIINQDAQNFDLSAFDLSAMNISNISTSQLDKMSDLDKFALIREIKDNF